MVLFGGHTQSNGVLLYVTDPMAQWYAVMREPFNYYAEQMSHLAYSAKKKEAYIQPLTLGCSFGCDF